MPFTGSIEDRHLIRERMSAYADAMFTQNLDSWLSNFAEDIVWKFGSSTMNGREALKASWPALWEQVRAMGYFTEVASIEVDGDWAKAKCYSRQIFFRKDGTVTKVVGLYSDVLERQGDAWVFAEREFSIIGTEPEGWVSAP